MVISSLLLTYQSLFGIFFFYNLNEKEGWAFSPSYYKNPKGVFKEDVYKRVGLHPLPSYYIA